MSKEAMKLALEALEEAWYHVGTFQPTEKAIDLYDEARTALREALAEQPAQRTWVNATTWRGLTVDEILYCVELENPKAIVEEVEAKLREKNGITRSKHDQ